jgi:acyl-CoA thioesterase-1
MIDHAKSSGARVLLIGMKLPPNYGPDYTKAFEGAFAEVAKRSRVALLPFMLEGFAEKPEYFQADRIHPNEKAQPLIVERVLPVLRPLLK